jgi:hypothetical protein
MFGDMKHENGRARARGRGLAKMHADSTAGGEETSSVAESSAGDTADLLLPEERGRETSASMRQRICNHFPSDRYAVFFEVRNATGFAQKRRDGYCDALVMGLWPSRGLELWGIEIKVSRADWLRELKRPEKAEEFLPYCHRWYVVAPADVIHPGELPPTWGHMAPARSGLRVVTSAPALTPRPADVGLLASIARSAADGWKEHPSYLAERDDWQKRIDQRVTEKTKSQRDRLYELVSAVATFEIASGVPIMDRYQLRELIRSKETPRELVEKLQQSVVAHDRSLEYRGAERLGTAVRTVLDGGVEHMREQLQSIVKTAQRIATSAEETLREQGLQDGEGKVS